MIDVNTMNQAFLAANPEIRKNLKKEYDKKFPKEIVMALKPKYAKSIYEGRKNWEFRKAPPPLFKPIYIYESAPVSKITGIIVFSVEIRGLAEDVFDIVKNNKSFTKNYPGISFLDLEEYVGIKKVVSALRIECVKRIDHPIEFDVKKVPQNWGTFRFMTVAKTKGGEA